MVVTRTEDDIRLQYLKDLDEHQSKTDPVFYCGRPGVPRIGPPRRIIQMPNEVLFLYEDMSGDAYRVIPTDGRKHREDANPSYYGNSVAHWEGKVLVIESKDFVDDSWMGERGYFHTDAMTTSDIAWVPFSSGFQSTPAARIQRATRPSEGWNINSHSTPATAGATA